MLEEARKLYEAEDDEEDLLTTDARLSECHVLQGDGAAGLELAAKALERAETLPGVSVVVDASPPNVRLDVPADRRPRSARESLDESLRIARASTTRTSGS